MNWVKSYMRKDITLTNDIMKTLQKTVLMFYHTNSTNIEEGHLGSLYYSAWWLTVQGWSEFTTGVRPKTKSWKNNYLKNCKYSYYINYVNILELIRLASGQIASNTLTDFTIWLWILKLSVNQATWAWADKQVGTSTSGCCSFAQRFSKRSIRCP